MARVPGGSYGALMATQGLYETSTVANCAIGTRLPMGDRVFFYGHAVATSAAGLLVASDASDAGPLLLGTSTLASMTAAQVQMSPIPITAAVIAGQKYLAFTDTDLANVTKHELVNGYVVLTDTAGVDQIYKIKDNEVYEGGKTQTVEIELWDEIKTAAADATTDVIIAQSQFNNLRPAVVGTDEAVVGVPMVSIAAGSYAWLQTWGPACVVTVTDTAFAGIPSELAGTGQVQNISAGYTGAIVGFGMSDVSAAGEATLFFLQLCP